MPLSPWRGRVGLPLDSVIGVMNRSIALSISSNTLRLVFASAYRLRTLPLGSRAFPEFVLVQGGCQVAFWKSGYMCCAKAR